MLTEGLLSSVKSGISDRISQATATQGSLAKVYRIWADAARESGDAIPRGSALAQVDRLRASVPPMKREIAAGESAPTLGGDPVDESLVTAVSIALAVVSGLPLVFGGAGYIAKRLGMQRTAAAMVAARGVTKSLEDRTIDTAIPDRISYLVYVKAYNAGFRVTPTLLTVAGYTSDRHTRERVESVMYRLLLAYFAWASIVECLEAGLSLPGFAHSLVAGVKVKEVTQGLRTIAKGLAHHVRLV